MLTHYNNYRVGLVLTPGRVLKPNNKNYFLTNNKENNMIIDNREQRLQYPSQNIIIIL